MANLLFGKILFHLHLLFFSPLLSAVFCTLNCGRVVWNKASELKCWWLGRTFSLLPAVVSVCEDVSSSDARELLGCLGSNSYAILIVPPFMHPGPSSTLSCFDVRCPCCAVFLVDMFFITHMLWSGGHHPAAADETVPFLPFLIPSCHQLPLCSGCPHFVLTLQLGHLAHSSCSGY